MGNRDMNYGRPLPPSLGNGGVYLSPSYFSSPNALSTRDFEAQRGAVYMKTKGVYDEASGRDVVGRRYVVPLMRSAVSQPSSIAQNGMYQRQDPETLRANLAYSESIMNSGFQDYSLARQLQKSRDTMRKLDAGQLRVVSANQMRGLLYSGNAGIYDLDESDAGAADSCIDVDELSQRVEKELMLLSLN